MKREPLPSFRSPVSGLRFRQFYFDWFDRFDPTLVATLQLRNASGSDAPRHRRVCPRGRADDDRPPKALAQLQSHQIYFDYFDRFDPPTSFLPFRFPLSGFRSRQIDLDRPLQPSPFVPFEPFCGHSPLSGLLPPPRDGFLRGSLTS